jgi:hypothetical protein
VSNTHKVVITAVVVMLPYVEFTLQNLVDIFCCLCSHGQIHYSANAVRHCTTETSAIFFPAILNVEYTHFAYSCGWKMGWLPMTISLECCFQGQRKDHAVRWQHV